jgi:hypothetical protein
MTPYNVGVGSIHRIGEGRRRPVALSTHLDAARTRRESLYQALVGLEEALSTPIGDGAKWRHRVAAAVEHVANRLSEHVASTEADHGFFDQINLDAPRLAGKTARLRSDHPHLEKAALELVTALAGVSDANVADQAPAIRGQALEFLGLVAAHRQRGADLIYEAYHVDIGGSS